MPTLPNMGLITPTQGGDSGTWDDKINAALALLDAHDHTSGKGVAVPVAGLDIDADLPLAGFGLTNLGKISFTTITAPTSGSKALFVNSADNELYWRTNAGVNVKLTSGTTINASLIGGIGGDYASVGAEVAFNDADKVYTFKDQSSPTRKWARISGGQVRIYEHNTTESVYIELAAPAALGASYTVTWPTAVPAVQSLLQMSTAGVVSTGGTGVDHDVTLAAGRSFTVSTTGKYKHDGRTIYLPAVSAGASVAAGVAGQTAGFPRIDISASTTVYIPLHLNIDEDAKVYGVTMYFNAAVGAGVVARLYEGANGVFSYLNETAAGSGSAQIVLTLGTPLSMAGVHPLWIRIVTDGSSACALGDFSVTYKVE